MLWPDARNRKGNLLRSGNMFPAADEPPHTGSVENAKPEPIPYAVVRGALAAWPFDDIDKADIESLTPHQSQHETVETIEIRER